MADAKINIVATDGASKVLANVRGEMARTKESAAGLVTALTALGLVGAAASLAGLVRGSIDAADHLRDLSQQTGISAVTLGGLGFAASQSGGDLESISAAAGKLNKTLAEAAAGSTQAAEPFKLLGISVLDAAGKTKSADVAMAEIADAFEKFADGPEKSALALRIFGKAGAAVISTLDDGGDSMRQNIAYYEKYSGVTKEVTEASDNFNDTIGKINLIGGALGNTLAASLLPSMQVLAEEFLRVKENGSAFQGVGDALALTLETLVAIGTKTAYAFGVIGREIGGWIAQLQALYNHDDAGFTAISAAIKEDRARADVELDALEQRLLGLGKKLPAAGEVANPPPKKPAPRLSTTDKTGTDQAKARLDLDLELIKRAAAAVQQEYANSENILQAMRGVGLLDDDAYYNSKRALVELNSESEAKAFADEITRRRAENLTGKDRLENQKKISELQGQMAAASAKSATELVVLGIQEKGAVDARAASYLSARQAAQDYYDTLQQGYARELASVGAGQNARAYNAGLAQVEDRFAQRRRDLENNRAQAELQGKFTPGSEAEQQYNQQLALLAEYQAKEKSAYTAQYGALKAAQGDWLNGAHEALANYVDSSKDLAGSFGSLLTNGFKSAEDALVSFVTTGKLNFKDFAASVLSDLTHIIIKQQLANVLASSFGSKSDGGVLGTVVTSLLGNLFGSSAPASSPYSLTTAPNYSGGGLGLKANAKGGAYTSADLSAYSGTVVSSPTLFAFAKGAGLMGEVGSEAIMPLTRSADGSLGVRSVGGQGGGTTVNVVVENHGTDANATSTTEQKPDGSSLVRIILRAVADDTATGGITARATAQRFALKTV